MTNEDLENQINLLVKITRKMENGAMNVSEAIFSVKDELIEELKRRQAFFY